jgi:hypothetical protein
MGFIRKMGFNSKLFLFAQHSTELLGGYMLKRILSHRGIASIRKMEIFIL